ncbi:nephrocystin-4 [Gymnogyps californianus]|uniref:nephrocystin-4 n=1 Tax=Gymnogyps californianus TaxID=33616 RepID=UPI0021C78D51|nr:nephrocystin-4 [Gymnogyps californianus]
MSEWERVFLQNLALPPHCRRRRTRRPGSTAFRCVLKYLEGAALAQGAEYHLRLSLFDATYHHFFGRTWRSRRRAARAAPPRPARAAFNETIYFHTSLNHPGIAAVVEVVATAGKGDEGSRHLSCGFGLIPLFGSGSEATEPAAEDRALKLYHGTPRALLHPRFQDPVEKNKYLTVMEKSHLQYALKPHQPLETIFHLLPENLLMSGLQTVPGLLPARGDASDCLQKPRLMKPVTCYLERLSVRLYPSLEEFEEELLDLLNGDRLLQANAMPDGDGMAVRERRLHIGVHNGLRFIQAPQVAVLVPEAEVARGGCPGVPSSGAGGAGQALVLRSRIHLNEMVPHPAFGICFQLEYVFCSSGRAGGKALPGGEAANMRSVRWAVWSPVLGTGEAEVVLPLRGGARRGPCQTLVYQTPPSGRSSRRGKHVESGTVQFHVSTDSEEHLVTAAEILRKDRDESEKPPTPSLSPPAPLRMAASPRGPGLSVSQLSAPPRGRDRSPTPRRRGSRQEGGITHLEADLGSPDPEPCAGDQLRALPFAPLQVPIAAVGLQAGSSRTLLSRASLARLHAAGFPEILDRNGQPVEISEPADPGSFSPRLEEADPLQGNEIILQFLAFGRDARDGAEGTWPRTVFLTFQFYRFPPVTTPRLQLVSTDGGLAAGPAVPAQLLVRVNKDGTLGTGPPGLQLKYMVDPAFLRPGEQRWFVRYLAEHSLQIDVWDGDSLLLVGSAAVKLEPLLRQGRAAVRTHHELEVATTEYEPDATVMGREALRHGALRPLGVRVAVRGRLHFCLANVGHPSEETPGQPPSPLPSRSRIVPTPDSAGSWFSLNAAGGRRVSRARRLVEVDGELAAALRSRRPEGWQEQRARHVRDLQIIDAYREHIKGESISQMLSQAITATRTVHAVLGTAEFFEFALKNPYGVQHTVTIEVDHPELSVILDPREWRHFKELTKSVTPVEEEMFHLRDDLKPQVYLRPNETVRIPFKYQTFSADPAVVAAQGPAGLGADAAARSLGKSGAGRTKHIEVSFQVSGGKPIALLRVKVEPQPHVVDQTFRFYHPELTFLKKTIRLPPWHTLPGAPVGMPGGEPEMFVRCSDPDVICETKNMGPGEPQDIFLKVAGGPSPQIKKFFVAIYTDAWLAAPVQIWQFYLHSLQRLDVSCTAGQLARLSLLLRGTPAPRRVRAFTSHPQELEVDPDGAFLLPANGIQDLYVGVRPRRAGSRFIYLNLVDVESQQLVSSWLLCLSCRQPLISKAFEISLPAGGGRGCNKRITYTNPYPSPRLYFLRTNRPDLLQFKEDSFEVAGGEVYTIGLRFAPSQAAGEEEILIHINDHEDKNEETFCVKVLYH